MARPTPIGRTLPPCACSSFRNRRDPGVVSRLQANRLGTYEARGCDRGTPSAPQCYVGEPSADGNMISGRWERGTELGAPLERDFDLNYLRVR
jgi:hypothetical protein